MRAIFTSSSFPNHAFVCYILLKLTNGVLVKEYSKHNKEQNRKHFNVDRIFLPCLFSQFILFYFEVNVFSISYDTFMPLFYQQYGFFNKKKKLVKQHAARINDRHKYSQGALNSFWINAPYGISICFKFAQSICSSSCVFGLFLIRFRK